IPLGDAFTEDGPRQVRLRTNLEVYWDQFSWAVREPGEALQVQVLAPDRADLRYRGFSELVQPNRQTPERPVYDRLVGTAPRWMDLEGFYTRFGDVRPLLREVDDRYVIMNAGAEFRFQFAAPRPPAPPPATEACPTSSTPTARRRSVRCTTGSSARHRAGWTWKGSTHASATCAHCSVRWTTAT